MIFKDDKISWKQTSRYNLGDEWRTVNVFIGELDVYRVLSRFCWQVGHRASIITVISTVQFGFRRTFNCQCQPTCKKTWNMVNR